MFDLQELKDKANLKNRYAQQIKRLESSGIKTSGIEAAVSGTLNNLHIGDTSALVVYGEPQSGKTEMMICLTAKLLDEGYAIIVHLMNDSVDLLSQNLRRFKVSGLAPSARTSTEFLQSANDKIPKELVVFCKKNGKDLLNLKEKIKAAGRLIIIDDEADYATPNTKVNQNSKTPINNLIEDLIGSDGFYIGVTATPARLDLNNTFKNDTERWVHFPPHDRYTGQEVFFPIDKNVKYRLKFLNQGGSSEEARKALVRFLVTAAYLNTNINKSEQNYTMLVHTSGKKSNHEADRLVIEKAARILTESNHTEFEGLALLIYTTASELYPSADASALSAYVILNASRVSLVVLNSERDRKAAGDDATNPSSPFTIIIGGNIVSRGVTFPNLLSMFFTRNVQHKLQQDTYIQRARMFGARNAYLEHFELAIPASLYADWHRCFMFHRLALATIQTNLGSPVWIGDKRIAVASNPSIDKTTVSLDKGEMSFNIFPYSDDIDKIILKNQVSISTLIELQKYIGESAIPTFLIDYIREAIKGGGGPLAIHTASSIIGYGITADQTAISRLKGFMGKPQLELGKFPTAVHHIKVFFNQDNRAKVFYKHSEGLRFIQNPGLSATASGASSPGES